MIAAQRWAALPTPVGALLEQRLAAITSGLPGVSSPRETVPPDGADMGAGAIGAGGMRLDAGANARARRLWTRGWDWTRAARASTAGIVVAQATGVWLATRVAYVIFTYFAVTFRYGASVFRKSTTAFAPHSLNDIVQTWKQWDAVWYMDIAAHGYSGWQSTAFFPLYPLLIRFISLFIGPHWLLAALIVNNLATWMGFIALSLLAMQEFGDVNMAWRVMLVAAAYPLAFFLTAPYTEGLFLAFAAFGLYFARRGAWRRAGAMAFLATLTHVTGVILIPPLVWEFARQHGWLDFYRKRLSQMWGDMSAYVWRRVLGEAVMGMALGQAGDAGLAEAIYTPTLPASEAALSLDPALVDSLSNAPASPLTSATASVVAAGRRRGSLEFNHVRERLWILLDLAFVAGGAPFAVFLYACYLEWTFGHPLLFYHAQAIYWQRQSVPIWRALPLGITDFVRTPIFSYWQARTLVDLAPIIVFGLLTLLTIRRIPFAFSLYMLGLVYLSISSPVFRPHQPDIFVSAGRFFVVAIPMFLLLGKWMERRRWLETLIVSGGFMLQAALASYFLSNGWLI